MDYEVIRSKRRTLAIEVTRECNVLVRAPMRCPNAVIKSFVNAHEAWISAQVEKLRKRAEEYPEPTDEEREALIQRAKEILPEKVKYYSEKLGLTPTKITITGAKTRFGSCSAKNAVCFSWRLMRYPEEAIDYVVVHELCHIAHHNHSREFYALIESVMPDYRKREKLLRG